MHMLIVALDYRRSERPLSATADARSVEELARQCGVHWLMPLYNEDATKPAVLDALRKMGSQCGRDDYLIFYFSGRGARAPTSDARSEANEAYACVQRNGAVSPEAMLLDSELRGMVTSSCHEETRIIILEDMCHSGTVVDLGREQWAGRQVVLVSGCQGATIPEDGIRSGVFTHSLLLAVDKLSKVGRDNYSLGMLYNAALLEDELVFGARQDLTIQTAPGFAADNMAWPLVPPVGYQAPLTRCAGPGGVSSNAAMMGISPGMLQCVAQEELNKPVGIEEYLYLVQGTSMLGFKPCRGCSSGCATGSCSVQ